MKRYENIYFTPGTGKYYGVSNDSILTYDEVIDMLKAKKVGLFIIVSRRDGFTNTKTNGWKLRRTAINTNTPVMTNIKCIKLYVYALVNRGDQSLTVGDIDHLSDNIECTALKNIAL